MYFILFFVFTVFIFHTTEELNAQINDDIYCYSIVYQRDDFAHPHMSINLKL